MISSRGQRKAIVAQGIENKEHGNLRIQLVFVFLTSLFCIPAAVVLSC